MLQRNRQSKGAGQTWKHAERGNETETVKVGSILCCAFWKISNPWKIYSVKFMPETQDFWRILINQSQFSLSPLTPLPLPDKVTNTPLFAPYLPSFSYEVPHPRNPLNLRKTMAVGHPTPRWNKRFTDLEQEEHQKGSKRIWCWCGSGRAGRGRIMET